MVKPVEVGQNVFSVYDVKRNQMFIRARDLFVLRKPSYSLFRL